ncbi:hypothetical protein ACN47E_003850 [Coniothyrium glycines]
MSTNSRHENTALLSSPPDPAKLELSPSERQTLTLLDGRAIGYAEYGSSKISDPAIFLFHGLPGCRLVGRSWDKLCKKIGARLITIDRPGCGLSSLADRRLVDWPDDVVRVADHLKIEKFSAVGASGGGPYALACARFIPRERLRSTTVVCGIGHIDSVFERYCPWRLFGLTQWLLGLATRYIFLPFVLVRPYLTKDPVRLKKVIVDQCKTDEEKSQLNDPDRDTNLDDGIAALLETFRQGSGGVYQDGHVLATDWGFDLANVESERVRLLHGDQDVQAPLWMAQWIDQRLGGGRLRVLEGQTHFTIWKKHEEEIFRASAAVQDAH